VIEGKQIRKVESARFLGICIDTGFSWRSHISQMATKMWQLLGVVIRIRSDLDARLLISFHDSMVLKHLMVRGDFEVGRNRPRVRPF
jgi:hypothetical protein